MTTSNAFKAIVVSFLASCSGGDTRIERSYYENGKVKSVLQVKNDKREGYCRYYYESGNLKYEGEFGSDLKVGNHKEYFDSPLNRLSKTAYYEVRDGHQVVASYIIYDTTGTARFESRFCERKLEVKQIGISNHVGDTLTLSIRIVDAELPMTAFILMNVDRFLNPEDSLDSQYFVGNDRHEVEFTVPLTREGIIRITGIVREFDIKEISDSVGMSVACDSYFEYKLRALDSLKGS